jgi:P pilus assembly chaperone PapD
MSLPITCRRALLAAFAVGFFLLLAGEALAQGVSVAPSRILLDGRTRSATVFLSNRGDQSETYRISLAPMVMREDGALIRADSTNLDQAAFAEEVVRYSPRRVVIPAGGSQTIRLLVRRPRTDDVGDVEYRAHLSVRSIPTVPRLDELESPLPEDIPEDQFVAVPVASVETLVPLVVRFGKPDATAAIADPQLTRDAEGRTWLEFDLRREGERSLYGQLTITHRSDDGVETEIHHGRGIALYTPNTSRHFRIQASGKSIDPTRGRITIDYVETEDGGGDGRAQAVVAPQVLSRN